MHHSGAAANAIIESRRRVSRETDQIMDRFRMPEYQLAFARYLASGNQHPFLVIDPDVAPPHIWEAFEDEVRRYGRDNAIFDFEIVPVDLRQLVVSVQEPLLLEERIRLLAAAELNRRRLSAVHAALVSMYQHTGRLGDMIQALLHLMLLNPDDGSLKASLASIYFSLGAYASALELLAHESVVPRDELILMKAHCLVLLNKVDQAREVIRRQPSYELNSAFLNLLRELD
jgi:tetratricopeptide (TPR) repeat protein